MRRAGQIFTMAGQMFAIVCICTLCYVIITKAVGDISGIIQNNPGDFWPNFIRYILANLGAY